MAGLEGKKILVFYDSLGQVSRKEGICTIDSAEHIVLDEWLIIPKPRLVRVEVSK